MSPRHIIGSIATAALGIALLGACSTESLTERAVSFGLEQAIEGDENIDLNLDGENGGFSISTDEGDFSVNFDEDNGGIVFDTDEGSGVISFDQDNGAINFDTDEGSGVISFDEDNGSINFDTDEGDGSINFNDDGSGVTLESDDGSFSIGATQVPDSWPQVVGVPTTADPELSTFNVFADGADSQMMGIFQHDPAEPYAAKAEAGLASLGFTVALENEDSNGRLVQFVNGNSIATVFSDNSGFTTVAITTG